MGPLSAAGSTKTYQVEEFIRVLTPVSFLCRLKGYEPAPSVRFQVFLRGISPQNATDSDAQFFKEQLATARKIELRNPVFRNYFRVEADVWADGNDLSLRLIKQNPSLAPTPEQAFSQNTQPSSLPRPASAISANLLPADVRYPAVRTRRVSLQTLLDTPVDCSSLRSDTPFSEALDFLCGSVVPRLPLVVLWGDLQANALVEKDTPIGVEGFGRMRLGQVLDSILRSVAVGQVKPVLAAEGGILTLGTRVGLQEKNKTRVYSIEDLLMAPSRADEDSQSGYGGQNRGNTR
ncbi:MAG TPA: hypothetical protein PK052_08620 [Anaerohalosphaeraceae bacterium]|nr:hypothetical protein [Phycisphaerae bacterium]HOK95231.1 hypothetical protein [Anaerohalosphaeraceae bacterium]HOL32032.1 hypothetical protein [Anaerohalosphaeraceae bacterium]HOM75089.1 hypothetical protein [Anaerohalosphaeraceae bacterium]HPC63156.1 hypothetical protein [Anaerohalosphaeraceae bacterium]